MTTAAQAPFLSGPKIGRSVVGHEIEVICAKVLAPFPYIAGHIVEAELVRRLACYLVRPCRFAHAEAQPADGPPTKARAQDLRNQPVQPIPARAVPGHGIWVIAAAVDESIRPVR